MITTPPNSAGRWVNCPGAPKMAKLHKRPSSFEAGEGDAVHWFAAQKLLKLPAEVGGVSPKGMVITEEMADYASDYGKDIMGRLVVYGPQATASIQVEKYVYPVAIHADMKGIVDCWAYIPQDNRLIIWELKYGRRAVHALENWQCMAVAPGCIREAFPNGAVPENLTIEIRVFQPRAFKKSGPSDVWEISFLDIRPYWDRLREAALEARTDSPRIISGYHCRDCKARYNCPSAKEAWLGLYEAVFEFGTDDLSADMMIAERELLKRAMRAVKDRLDGIDTEIKYRLENGEAVGTLGLAPKAGKVEWARPAEQIITLGKLMSVNLEKPRDVVTPKQAFDLGLREDLVKGFLKTSTGIQIIDTAHAAKKLFGGK